MVHDDRLLRWLKHVFNAYPNRAFTIQQLAKAYKDTTDQIITSRINQLLDEGYIVEATNFSDKLRSYRYNFASHEIQKDVIKQFVTACRALKASYPDVEIFVRSEKNIPFG